MAGSVERVVRVRTGGVEITVSTTQWRVGGLEHTQWLGCSTPVTASLMVLLQSPLHRAVILKHARLDDCLAAIHAALEAGEDVNGKDSQGRTPLLYAACLQARRHR